MMKKIMSAFLAVAMIMSMATTSFATKKDEATAETVIELENVTAMWGGFESAKTLGRATLYPNGTTISLADEGALGSEHSLLIDARAASSISDVYIYFPAVSGETYDVSFYTKDIVGKMETVQLIFSSTETGYIHCTTGNVSTEWTKYETTFFCKSNVENGAEVPGKFMIRFGGNPNGAVLIDEFSVRPHGDVYGDYSSLSAEYLSGGETEIREPATINGEVSFADTQGHWAESTINTLAKFGYISGMGNNTFAPDEYVTRAQFIKMIEGVYGLKKQEYDGRFADVSGDEWYADSLLIADKLDLIDVALKAGGYISPNAFITREEAATIAARAAKDRGAVFDERRNTVFTDSESVAYWAKDGVKDAAAYGMIYGYDDGSYKPKNTITRAEAAQILFRVVELKSKMHIFVDSKIGNDENIGTSKEPLKTIVAARDMAAKFAPDMKNNITIYIRGEQKLEKPFTIDENNSGKNGYKIIYTSWGEEKANITMHNKYADFKLYDAEKNIWRTYVGEGIVTRQAYFNDVKGIRARSAGRLKNCERIDKQYFLCDNTELLEYAYPEEVDMVFHYLWVNPRFLIKSVSKQDGRVKVDMTDYYKKYVDPYNYTTKITAQPSYIENAYELLDVGGEWYLNRHDGYMYYIPRKGENMQDMVCEFSVENNLIIAKGASHEKPLENVTFDNLIFEGTTWTRPDEVGGFQDSQAAHLHEEAYVIPDDGAAIEFAHAKNILISNCVFRQFGYDGLMLNQDIQYFDIIGNEFYDISATSARIDCGEGNPQKRNTNTYVEYVNFMNNYVHHTATDYNGAAGVTIGFPRFSKFNHNEICNVPYTGIHIGWGWYQLADTGSVGDKWEIAYNYIHDVMTDRLNDGACIYNLGSGPLDSNSYDITGKRRIVGNYLVNGWNCTYVYPDEGSTGIYIADNVSDTGLVERMEYNFDRAVAGPRDYGWLFMHTKSIKWISIGTNYSNADYRANFMNQTDSDVEPTTIVKDNNWPDEAKAIMNNAGIEPEYRDNFDLDAPVVLANLHKWRSIPLNEPVDAKQRLIGAYNKQFDLADYDVDIMVDEPGAVTIDENGYITAHKQGTYEVEVVVTYNGFTETNHCILSCGDKVETLGFTVDKVNMVTGYETDVRVQATTHFGNVWDINDTAKVDVHPEDEGIIEIEKSENGYRLKSVGSGSTNLVGTIENEGMVQEVCIPVTIISYNSEEGATLPFREVNLLSGWKDTGKAHNGGMKIAGSPTHYTREKFKNELIAFDVSIDPGSSWPTIAFCDSDVMNNYSKNDCYMMGFKENIIELQRFNKGERTMIFGDEFNPIGGPGIPNKGDEKKVEYNKRYSVVMGALDTEEGTRIILNINGENVIDYIDNATNALDAEGYLVIYNPAPGGMTFYPYSGITNK